LNVDLETDQLIVSQGYRSYISLNFNYYLSNAAFRSQKFNKNTIWPTFLVIFTQPSTLVIKRTSFKEESQIKSVQHTETKHFDRRPSCIVVRT
jgi:hypothetical protein